MNESICKFIYPSSHCGACAEEDICKHYSETITMLNNEVEQLKKQIEQMKCCGNCQRQVECKRDTEEYGLGDCTKENPNGSKSYWIERINENNQVK